MVEIRQYLLLARKWLWLIVAGAVIGAGIGYIISLYQPTIYQTSTKIMVSRGLDQDQQTYYFFNEVQLAKTYSQLLNTGPLLDQLSQKLGYQVSKKQVLVKQVTDSLLIDLSVQDSDPQRAADIANGLVTVFIEYNNNLQAVRYQTSEESLQTQITQVQNQIQELQKEMSQISEATLQTQRQEVNARIGQIEKQLNDSESQIIQVEKDLAGFFPAPLVTFTPAPYWREPTSTPVPVPTPTLSPSDETKFKELQLRLDQLKGLRDLYKSVYAQLLVMDDNSGASDPKLRSDQIQTALALYQQIYSNLLSNYENVRLARLRSTPNITQVEVAAVPESPIQPKPLQNMLLGLLGGSMLMAAIAFAIEFLDDTLKTPEDVNQHLHLPVIGLIGEMDRPKPRVKEDKKVVTPGVFVAENPLSPVTEAFRTLRTNIDFAAVDKPIKTLLVTSTSPSEGKSTISTNLAAILAQGDRKVVLVDADLRRPSVHRYLGIPNRKGMSDLFRDQTKLSNVISTWGNPPFAVITSGGLPPNPTELLESEKMESILLELKEKSDIVIVDSAPAIVADPIALSARIDAVLLVIEPGKTKIDAAQVLMEQFLRAGARVIGVVLNPISRRRAHYYSKYRYYTTYYYYSQDYNRYLNKNGSSRRKKNSNGAKPEAVEEKPITGD
jgi:capsular exopolysaccharide synthesis family protein